MVNIGKILKRSWVILWNYRVLWVFGVLLALTSGGGSSGNSGGGSRSGQGGDGFEGFNGRLPDNAPPWLRELSDWFVQNVQPLFTNPEAHVGTFVTIGLVIMLIIVLFSMLAALVRYPAETAAMRMVDEYEQSGVKLGFRAAWRLGWSRRALRLWLIDLLMSLPALLFVLLMLAGGLLLYFSVSLNRGAGAVGAVGGIGLVFLSLFVLLVVAVALGLLRNFFVRAAALEGKSTMDSLRSGWGLFKRNWKSALVMWLVMIGIGFAYGLAGILLFFLLIPVYLILLIPAALVAALPGLAGYGIASLFTISPVAWIIAALAAAPFFFTVVFAPLVLIGGWYKIYELNVWTLTYREVKALESLGATPAAPAPALAPEA